MSHLKVGSAFDTLFSDLCCFLHRGFIALENKTFIIEPMSSDANDTHFIYRVEKLKLSPGDCGHGFNMSSVATETHIKNPFQSFHARVRSTSWYIEPLDVAFQSFCIFS